MANLAEINKLIKNVRLSTTNQNKRVQQCAVMCIEHLGSLGKNGQPINDANPAMRLVDAVAPRLRGPLTDWFAKYSRVNIAKSGGKLVCSVSKAAERRDDILGAESNPWYEFEKAKADELPTTLEDLNDGVINLVKRMEKKLADGKVAAEDAADFRTKLEAIKAMAA